MWPLAIIAFGVAFSREEEWGNFWMISSFILATVALSTSGVLKFIQVYDGLFERIGMGADLLWMFLVSLNLFFQDQQRKIQNLFNSINLSLKI
jgi:hypothetical protein